MTRKSAGNIVILTGAGISADSGIQTFRGSDGLWCGHRVEDVATPEAFRANPALVQDFYNRRRRQLLEPSIQPNAAHIALAELEKNWRGDITIVTQNIDDLHDRAGNKNLIHMHGELLSVFCNKCESRFHCREDVTTDHVCANCQETGTVRPDIVWFGEMPYRMDEIYEALSYCDLFIAIGTSGHVYPAAGFVAHAGLNGAKTVEINIEESQVASVFDEHISGRAAETVPEYVKQLLTYPDI
ncbi:MAG: NAD-dependent protein deacylase [Rhodospirillales bacterium]|nr:NAD-dependent protein deacylase [Rhodospirillales bacterium]